MDDYSDETLEQAAGISAIASVMARYFLEKEEARELFYQWMVEEKKVRTNDLTRDEFKGGLEIARDAYDQISQRAANKLIAKRLVGFWRWSPN